MRTLVQLLGGGVEQPLLPTHPPMNASGSTAKRKITEEGDVLGKPAKRSKNDTSTKSSTTAKRKLHGEEQIGGLVIVRGPAPPARPSSAQESHRPPSSQPQIPPRPASTQPDDHMNAQSSRSSSQPLPAKKLKPVSSSVSHTAVARADGKGKERETPLANGSGEDGGAEEDVRRMDSEAEDLRERSRFQAASMPPDALQDSFKFPPPSTAKVKSRVRQLQVQTVDSRKQNLAGMGTPPVKSVGKDSMQLVPERETPQIAKNKVMRGEHPSARRTAMSSLSVDPSGSVMNPAASGSDSGATTPGHSRRRSSISMRGKRASTMFENTGIISKPHTTVSDSSLYKHINPDLPESQRARQLLIWASGLAQSEIPGSTARRRKSISKVQTLPLPPLPPGGLELLKSVQDDLMRQLAEKMIDTSVHTPPGEAGSGAKKQVKENEQNVKNRAREKLFLQQIEERKAEETAWGEVSQFYNAHQANVLSSLDKRHRARAAASAKVKGKQRATSQEPSEFEPREFELPEQFRGANGYEVSRRLTELNGESIGKNDKRWSDFQYKTDRILAAISSACQLAQVASSDLDHRFSLLSVSLSQRSQLPTPQSLTTTNPAALSNYLPQSQLPQQRTTDPQELIRALSRVDAERPREKVGEAVRRAAKDVQRVQDGGDGDASGRRLTGVPPPTPRKAPGTPRRATTPSTSRKG